MSNHLRSEDKPTQPVVYKIRVKGHLSREWSDWFEGLSVTLDDNGDMLLSGAVADQAALHGLLKKVRDIGMTLLSVNSAKPGAADASGASQEPNDRIGAR